MEGTPSCFLAEIRSCLCVSVRSIYRWRVPFLHPSTARKPTFHENNTSLSRLPFLNSLTRMSHKGGGERRKAARSASGASSTSGNHRTGLLLRICSPSSPRMYRFFVRARQSTPQIGRRTQIRLATPFLSAAQSCDLQLPVHLAEQLQVRIARRQRHPDLAYGDANLGPDLEQL